MCRRGLGSSGLTTRDRFVNCSTALFRVNYHHNNADSDKQHQRQTKCQWVMPKLEDLCTYCAVIPLDPDTLTKDHDESFADPFDLGPWSRVQRSRCPLCKLVKSIIFKKMKDFPDLVERHGGAVLVGWAPRGGPGRRGALNILIICFAAQQPGALSMTNDAYYLQDGTRRSRHVANQALAVLV
jgi:hypothetical protein